MLTTAKPAGALQFTVSPLVAIHSLTIIDDDLGNFGNEDTSLGFQFTITGFIELENFINTYTNQDFSDANKKNELRTKLSIQAGTQNNYFKCEPNIYLLPYIHTTDLYPDYHYTESDFSIARNGRISGKNYELSLNECYFNIGYDKFRIRAGNQIYTWGTADFFNPTSCINPSDSREIFYKEADESKPGVPSISSMLFFSSKWSLELVFVPVHIGSITPTEKNFWAYHYNLGFLDITGNRDTTLPPEWGNLGYGARLAGSLKGVDLSLSCYQGPDSSPLLRPMAYDTNLSDIVVRQEYYTSTNIGCDFSFTVSKFEIHGELAYSPNKYGVVDENCDLVENPELLQQPFGIKSSHYISYVTGFNFTYKKLVFASEWLQSHYFKNDLMEPFYTHFIASAISYDFFDEFLNLSFAGVYDVRNMGYLIMPAASLDFECGIRLKLAYGHIGSKPGDDLTVFRLYDNKDILIIGVRYVF